MNQMHMLERKAEVLFKTLKSAEKFQFRTAVFFLIKLVKIYAKAKTHAHFNHRY